MDFEVVWNPDVYGKMNYHGSDFSSTTATENILCDISRTASTNMNAWSDYKEYTSRRLLQPPPPGGGGGGGSMSTMTTMSGLAVTGGAIFNGLAGGNVDALENEVDTLDQCLSHASPTGQ